MKFRFALVGCLVLGVSAVSSAAKISPRLDEIIFQVGTHEFREERYEGEDIQINVYTDQVLEEDKENMTVIRLDKLTSRDSLITMLRIYLYQNGCDGVRVGFFEYAGEYDKGVVLPQVFAAAVNTCIGVEVYRHNQDGVIEISDQLNIKVIESHQQ